MATPKRILFVMEDLCFGGTQKQTLQLAKRLDRTRFSPMMLTLTGETDLDDQAREADIALMHIGSSRRVDPLFFLKVPGWLKKLQPDVLVPCTALPNIWVRLWGKSLRSVGLLHAGILGTVRGGGGPFTQHEALLWRFCDHMVCNTQDLVRVLESKGVKHEHLTYIPNGVNTDFFTLGETDVAQREARILCVARLCADKDHGTLLRAFAKVYAERPHARLRLVGDGPLQAQIEQECASSSAKLGIELFPGTQDVRPHYHSARLFALSSVREGQPNVILEAMACGLPICATNVGGIPQLVQHGENGLLAAAKDEAQLAQNLILYLDNPSLCAQIGRRNRAKVIEDFSFNHMVAAHETLFSALCEQYNP